jgi:branched-subunit amino acid ABC-type transport system permease component
MEIVIIRGLSLAGIYFVISFGVTFLYGVGGFPNLTIGPIGLAGAYVTASLIRNANDIYTAVLSGLAIAVLIGIAIQRFLVEPLFKVVGGGDRGRIFVIYGTFGLTLLAPAIMLLTFKSTTISMRMPGLVIIRFMAATITGYELMSIVIAVVLFATAHFVLVKTKVGDKVRAVTQNAVLANLIGIKVRNIYLIAAAIASVCSYVGAVLWGEIFSLDLGSGMMFTLYGLIVSVMGGLGSISGAFLVSLILGMAISFTSYYIGGVFEHIVTTFILIIVLIVAPRGIVPTRREV